jgi:hypothetical protein
MFFLTFFFAFSLSTKYKSLASSYKDINQLKKFVIP